MPQVLWKHFRCNHERPAAEARAISLLRKMSQHIRVEAVRHQLPSKALGGLRGPVCTDAAMFDVVKAPSVQACKLENGSF